MNTHRFTGFLKLKWTPSPVWDFSCRGPTCTGEFTCGFFHRFPAGTFCIPEPVPSPNTAPVLNCAGLQPVHWKSSLEWIQLPYMVTVQMVCMGTVVSPNNIGAAAITLSPPLSLQRHLGNDNTHRVFKGELTGVEMSVTLLLTRN